MFHDLGYETSLNIMALSSVPENQLIEAFEMVKKSPVDVVYIVDSFGSLDPADIEHQVKKFQAMIPSKQLGIHTHNNMQLAFANTLTAALHFLIHLFMVWAVQLVTVTQNYLLATYQNQAMR
jgi:4-hydroxy 2-oxovalerate aldolase